MLRSMLFAAVIAAMIAVTHSLKVPQGVQSINWCPSPAQPVPIDGELPMLPAAHEFLQSLVAVANASSAQSMVAAVVYRDSIVAWTAFGEATPGGAAPKLSTVYRIGSVSKVFTSMMMMLLAEQGKISILDPVTTLVPEYAPRDPYTGSSRQATWKDLSSHMAGLPRYSPCDWGNCNISLAEAVARMNNWTLLQAPGTFPMYSNVGFSLLGRGLEVAAGTTWEDFVTSSILKPLGLNTTFVSAPESGMAAAFVGGEPAPLGSLGFEAPAGTMFSSAQDLAKLGSMFMNFTAPKNVAAGHLFDGNVQREWLMEPVFVNPLVVEPGYILSSGFGMPWELAAANMPGATNFSQFTIRGKDGDVPGYQAQLLMVPELQLATVIMVAQNNKNVDQVVGTHLVNTATILVPAWQDALQQLAPLPQAPPSPTDFVGNYGAPGSSTPAVTLDFDKATNLLIAGAPTGVRTTDIHAALGIAASAAQYFRWVGHDTFQMTNFPEHTCWAAEGNNVNNLHFYRSSTGQVIGFGLEGFSQYGLLLEKQQ